MSLWFLDFLVYAKSVLIDTTCELVIIILLKAKH